MPNLTNPEYWQTRAERNILSAEKSAEELSQVQLQAFKAASKQINADIERFYGRYATDVGVTIEEAQKALSRSELKDYKEQSQEYLDAIAETGYSFDPLYKQRLSRRLSLKAAVSRLEALNAQIEWEIENIYARQQSQFKEGLSLTYEDSYYRQTFDIQQGIGFGSPFSTLNKADIDSAVSQKWLGENYSDRIWTHKDQLFNDTMPNAIPARIIQGIILGHNPRKIAKDLLEIDLLKKGTTPMKTAYNNAVRLARTEFVNIANEASLKAYDEAGIEKYEYLATLDHRVSEICSELDGKVFNLKDRQVGINAPVMHPNCRSSQIPYFPPDEIDALFEQSDRIARDPETGKNYKIPANQSYQQWIDNLPEEKQKAMETTRKMTKNEVADKKQFVGYKEFLKTAKLEHGKDTVSELFIGFPSKFENFQEKKYKDSNWWEIVKENRKMLR